jgi:[acyl-carrier-protein] S-malonyltransferase
MSKTAFLFPGQGSQSLGMLAELAAAMPVVNETFDVASEVLSYDLWEICQAGPVERLNQTEVTQPAMLTADIATWRAWLAAGGSLPDYAAGHSLGEYAALVAANAMEFTDAVRLVAERGRLMQSATPEGVGAMAAILGLDDAAVVEVCAAHSQGQVVSCANFNSPGQVVIAGHREAVDRVCSAAKEAGARRALPLPVSVPSHCALMQPAAEALEPALAAVNVTAQAFPVVQNADVSVYANGTAVREALARQLWQPVRWTESIQWLNRLGVNRFLECGPGKVLAGLNRRITKASDTTALVSLDAIQAATGEVEK